MTDARSFEQAIEVVGQPTTPAVDAYVQAIEVVGLGATISAQTYMQAAEVMGRGSTISARVFMQAIEVMIDQNTANVYMQAIEVMLAPDVVPPVLPQSSSVVDLANTTFIDFVPSSTSPFQFQAILDGTAYTVIVTWNVFGQRYYINIYTLSGALVVCFPMIGSPLWYNISMTAGYFTTLLVFRQQNQQFEIIEPA